METEVGPDGKLRMSLVPVHDEDDVCVDDEVDN